MVSVAVVVVVMVSVSGPAAAAVVHCQVSVLRRGDQDRDGLGVESIRLGLNQLRGWRDKRGQRRSTRSARNTGHRRNSIPLLAILVRMMLMLQLLLQLPTLVLNLMLKLLRLVFNLVAKILFFPVSEGSFGFELFGMRAGLLFCEVGLVFEEALLGLVGSLFFGAGGPGGGTGRRGR